MKTQILVVEDDGTIAMRLERLLDKWGYGVMSTGSGEEAVTLAKEYRPDVAVLDIRLNDDESCLDGIDTAQRLRAEFGIPAIYLTAYADDEVLQRARATEPYGYLVKPLQELSLRSTLEMAVARIQADARLTALAQEREILIREIHHRVKNNMAAIIGLLSLMEDRVQDEQALHVLQQGSDRIRAMTSVHQMLYHSNDITHIGMREYLTDIVYHLFHSYGVSFKKVALQVEVDAVMFELDRAVPCGMLVNELVSNSLKYAFPGDASGMLTVALHDAGDAGYELLVRDTGVGLPEGADMPAERSLGMTLIAAWSEQLHGEYTFQKPDGTASGTCFRLNFHPRES